MTGKTRQEHLKTLGEVFHRLNECGLDIRESKCEFLKESVEYLGHLIDKDDLHMSSKKIGAIFNAPVPTSVSQLQAFWGLVNY